MDYLKFLIRAEDELLGLSFKLEGDERSKVLKLLDEIAEKREYESNKLGVTHYAYS